MAGNVRRSPRAERDLIEIWNFIATDNERAADGVLDRIEGALEMLANNPLAGRARPELGAQLRSFPVGAYVIFHLGQKRGYGDSAVIGCRNPVTPTIQGQAAGVGLSEQNRDRERLLPPAGAS